ncbi:hydroxyisourate hydrolase [Paenibacillus piri]|uniref:5-hydroxyisourate hydrolase n=1 Tax=Paenibacillus piri TaxID=2547395 RepID=A0A4R5KWX6_9BACL|nr:hydroxyisourate hydrolase [Paenibacillus piri]TDG00550.1 hydroxyisourate hydrolase [Paenibacillus piri]
MSGRLTSHVLELSAGRPAQGMRLTLYRLSEADGAVKLAEAVTNRDGRLDEPLLNGGSMETGTYELLFEVGEYYRSRSRGQLQELEPPGLWEAVPIRFRIGSTEEHYHIPLLIAPGGYSTYRGS